MQLSAASLWIFSIQTNNEIFIADSTQIPLVWTPVPYGGSGVPLQIAATMFPSPLGPTTLFVVSDDSSLWSFTTETGEWLQRVPPSTS
jgi:hypothetical protein